MCTSKVAPLTVPALPRGRNISLLVLLILLASAKQHFTLSKGDMHPSGEVCTDYVQEKTQLLFLTPSSLETLEADACCFTRALLLLVALTPHRRYVQKSQCILYIPEHSLHKSQTFVQSRVKKSEEVSLQSAGSRSSISYIPSFLYRII